MYVQTKESCFHMYVLKREHFSVLKSEFKTCDITTIIITAIIMVQYATYVLCGNLKTPVELFIFRNLLQKSTFHKLKSELNDAVYLPPSSFFLFLTDMAEVDYLSRSALSVIRYNLT